MKINWIEWLFVLGLGLPLSIVVNHHSASGLDLARDYFPGEKTIRKMESQTLAQTFDQEVVNGVERLKSKGLESIALDELVALMESDSWMSGLTVFVDARTPEQHAEGHLPLAYLFNHYRPEPYLDEVMAASVVADRLIVYCNGGSCEDSEFAAQYLMEVGIPREKLAVFAGGMRQWKEAGLPIVLGDRHDDVEEWLGQMPDLSKPMATP